MKTQTKAQILELIDKNGKTRPIELQKSLNISAQAIHRHIKVLLSEGKIEAQGSPPFTAYTLAGVPDLAAAAEWANAATVTKSPPSFVCETREILSARLPRLSLFVSKGLSEDVLPLVISSVGEIGNNSFDHNLGQWRDVPGCWFEAQVTGRQLWVCIADRGQGIFQSLVKVHPHLANEQAALQAAFETIISGRAPEQRGNGLKFVRKNLTAASGGGLACMSGTARVFYGEQGKKCMDLLGKHFVNVRGTVTLMVWKFL